MTFQKMTCIFSGGHFIYSNFKYTDNHTATVEYNGMIQGFSTVACFAFWYYMNSDAGTLNVYLHNVNKSHMENIPVWTRSVEQNKKWNKGEIELSYSINITDKVNYVLGYCAKYCPYVILLIPINSVSHGIFTLFAFIFIYSSTCFEQLI